MKDQLRHEWASLMQEGVHGQATRFRLRAMRLAQMVRSSDPELSSALTSGLAGSSTLSRLTPQDSSEDTGLLTIETKPELHITPFWPKSVESELQQIAKEWTAQETLLSAGLYPIKTVLLHGPPGVGKTLAARWLAEKIGMPLATLSLARTMNSYLGKTGQNIVKVLEYARTNPCVLFFDEFDAIAKRRSDDQDVGELKRVVNVLLQAVDQWTGPSLLVAATNHESLLDAAIARRFESSIEFPAASEKQIRNILKSLGVSDNTASILAHSLEGQPISNATRLVNTARKRAILTGVSFEVALQLFEKIQVKTTPVAARRDMTAALHASGRSAHQIAKELGVSHTTVLRDLKTITEE